MKIKRQFGVILVIAGLLMIIFSRKVVSFFGTTTILASGGSDNSWYRVTKYTPPRMASEWTWAIVGAGLLICSWGVWILFRRKDEIPDSN